MQFDSFSSLNESSSHSSDYESIYFDDVDKLPFIADSFLSGILEDNYKGKYLMHFCKTEILWFNTDL